MEAKDRKRFKVKRTIGYGTYSDKELKQYLEAQAEISFKAGRLEERKNVLNTAQDVLSALEDGRQAGIREVAENYYCVPKWCRMHPSGHFDSMAGCWGISSGFVPIEGEDYCKKCESHKDNVGKLSRNGR